VQVFRTAGEIWYGNCGGADDVPKDVKAMPLYQAGWWFQPPNDQLVGIIIIQVLRAKSPTSSSLGKVWPITTQLPGWQGIITNYQACHKAILEPLHSSVFLL